MPVGLPQQPYELVLARLGELLDGGDARPAQMVAGGRTTPGSIRTGIGPSSARSVPGSIRTRPSGLACSEAIFASILEAASPTDPVSPVTARMSARSLAPVSRADASSHAVPPASRSTNASSRLSGSTSGDKPRSSPITCSLTSRYNPKRGTR